jgi:hypothetical protein
MRFFFRSLPMLGAMTLLFAWLTQQFLYERWNGRLSAIATAESVFYTYQSNNALFNALFELTPESKQGRLRDLQQANYRDGLAALQKQVPEDKRRSVGARTAELEKRYSSLGALAPIQAELTSIQEFFQEAKERTAQEKAFWQKTFWGLYVLGSLLVLVGNIYKEWPARKEKASA